MARVFWLEGEVIYKSLRHLISIIAWTWAILVFVLSYFGRGQYNHINNRNEQGPPPLFQTVFVPVLKVLVVAPSAFGQALEPGNHASVQANSQFTPHSYSNKNNNNPMYKTWTPQQEQEQGYGGGLCAGCLPSTSTFSSGSGLKGREGLFLAQQRNSNGLGAEPAEGLRNGQGAGYSYDVHLTQPPRQWGQPGLGQDPSTVQHLQIHTDGQYSFSYNSADSSRQERRNLDGSVEGNYGYTDTEGQQVQVEYRASPSQGYQAMRKNVGDRVGPPVPVPVQDTPEVQAARAQFFAAYEEQLKRIEAATGARDINREEAQKVVSIFSDSTESPSPKSGSPPASEGSEGKGSGSDFKNRVPDPIPVPHYNSLQHSELVEEDDELDNDAIVISSSDVQGPPALPTSASQRQEEEGTGGGSEGPSPAFQLTQTLGADGKGAGLGAPSIPPRGAGEGHLHGNGAEEEGGKNQVSPPLPAYFYFVSVGGGPYYVTSPNLMRSDFPTSLKASLVGAIPLSAVHDAQVRQSSGGQGSLKATPPVYLEPVKGQEQQGFSYTYSRDNMAQMSSPPNNNFQQQQQQQNVPYVYGFIPGSVVSSRTDGWGGWSGQRNRSPLLSHPFFAFRK